MAKLKMRVQDFFFKPYLIEKKLEDTSLQLKIHNYLSKQWYDRAHDWVELTWVKKNLVREGDVIIDCGAHNGFTSLFFCSGFQNVKSIAFEAHYQNAVAATENVALNKMDDRIKIINKAVSNIEQEVTIFNQSNSGITKSNHRNTQKVQTVVLDNFPFEKEPTLLKVDVEGHELQVLLGAQKLLRTKPKLDIEIHASILSEMIITNIFELIDIDAYQNFIQLSVDGPIEAFDKKVHTPAFLSTKEVVHYFAIPLQ